jgi:hypothetical protein
MASQKVTSKAPQVPPVAQTLALAGHWVTDNTAEQGLFAYTYAREDSIAHDHFKVTIPQTLPNMAIDGNGISLKMKIAAAIVGLTYEIDATESQKTTKAGTATNDVVDGLCRYLEDYHCARAALTVTYEDVYHHIFASETERVRNLENAMEGRLTQVLAMKPKVHNMTFAIGADQKTPFWQSIRTPPVYGPPFLLAGLTGTKGPRVEGYPIMSQFVEGGTSQPLNMAYEAEMDFLLKYAIAYLVEGLAGIAPVMKGGRPTRPLVAVKYSMFGVMLRLQPAALDTLAYKMATQIDWNVKTNNVR